MSSFEDHTSESIGIQTETAQNTATQTDNSSDESHHIHRGHDYHRERKKALKPIFVDQQASPGFSFKAKQQRTIPIEDLISEQSHQEDSPPGSPEEFFSAEGSPTFPTPNSPSSGEITTIFIKTTHSITNRTLLKKGKSIIVVCPKQAENLITHDKLTEGFVERFNSEIGNEANLNEAKFLLNNMKMLGGLKPGTPNQPIDIPAARLGFSILAMLNDPKCKHEALESLYQLLKNDSLDIDSANQLVSLAIKFMKNMNKQLFQTEILEDQIKIAKVYSILASLLQQHYAKKHINAITSELKTQLIETAKALKDLNRQEDDQLTYHVNCALRGIRRLKDDSKTLINILNRIYLFGSGIISIKYSGPGEGFNRIDQACANLDPHLKKKWYNLILLIENLAKEANKDPGALAALMLTIQSNYKKTNWKFSYGATLVLLELTLHGSKEEIRKAAFNGLEQIGFSGLTGFSGLVDLRTYLSWKPMLHMSMPKRRDPNLKIRQACVEHLLIISRESKDRDIREQARRQLTKRLILENDPTIRKVLENALPSNDILREQWIRE